MKSDVPNFVCRAFSVPFFFFFSVTLVSYFWRSGCIILKGSYSYFSPAVVVLPPSRLRRVVDAVTLSCNEPFKKAESFTAKHGSICKIGREGSRNDLCVCPLVKSSPPSRKKNGSGSLVLFFVRLSVLSQSFYAFHIRKWQFQFFCSLRKRKKREKIEIA